LGAGAGVADARPPAVAIEVVSARDALACPSYGETHDVDISRGGPLGNPYGAEGGDACDADAAAAVRLHQAWLHARVATAASLMAHRGGLTVGVRAVEPSARWASRRGSGAWGALHRLSHVCLGTDRVRLVCTPWCRVRETGECHGVALAAALHSVLQS
jgi:hypothetical protein